MYTLCICVIPGSQLQADQIQFSKMLSKLKAQPVFQLRDLESTIDFTRDIVAKVNAYTCTYFWLSFVCVHCSILRCEL